MKSKVVTLSAISAALTAIVLTLGAYIELVDLYSIVISSVFVILPLYPVDCQVIPAKKRKMQRHPSEKSPGCLRDFILQKNAPAANGFFAAPCRWPLPAAVRRSRRSQR